MEKSVNYPEFSKLNVCGFAVYLNDPNWDLLPEIKKWCKQHNLKIDNTSIYKAAIRIIPIDEGTFPFEKHLEVLKLFSL